MLIAWKVYRNQTSSYVCFEKAVKVKNVTALEKSRNFYCYYVNFFNRVEILKMVLSSIFQKDQREE
jgi:hypothetical protein